jgi:hypothetical protein
VRSSGNIAEAKDIRTRACQSWKKAFWYSWWGLSWMSPFDIIITCAKSECRNPLMEESPVSCKTYPKGKRKKGRLE